MYTVLNVKHTVQWDAQLIEKGVILANHRCALDWVVDCYITKSSSVGRGLAFVASGALGLLIWLEGRGIILYRGKDKREQVYQKIVAGIQCKHRVCFWPEGTRLNYTTLSSAVELRTHLKYGLLKSIYFDKQFPVQLCISSNKEIAFSEKNLVARRGIPIRTVISKPINPQDFNSEEEFYNEIASVWFDCWKNAYTEKIE
jgi:1-acyl-sn-glycerol-3-phosphate acyltransferase